MKKIDCAKCRYYDGSTFGFVCNRGFVQETSYSTNRTSCAAYIAKTPAELAFDGYKHDAKFYGDRDIKKDRTQMRRLSTQLSDITTKRIGKSLSPADLETLKAASKIVSKLASNLDDACLLAKAAKSKRDKAEKTKLDDALKRLTAAYLSGLDADGLVAMARDLAEFDRSGIQWLKDRRLNKSVMLHSAHTPKACAESYLAGRTSLSDLRLSIAKVFHELEEADSSHWAGIDDFLSFRKR